mmetsp:Transcript_20132/g.45617  ORF Transcript_20132/g.45617 Transcript_20132/m.45617 type:complete len:396 (-) Transcript_20132:33-1220(-)
MGPRSRKRMTTTTLSPLHSNSSTSRVHRFISNQFEYGFLSKTMPQYLFFASGVMIFFGLHNYLQEAIMNIEGFEYGVMLGTMEVLGVTVCSFLERHFIARERGRIAPLRSFFYLTACLLSSSALSNISLNYINFPTKVVFRSCKLIPTMLIGSLINGRRFSLSEYMVALAVCFGLVLFAAADWENSPNFHPIGLICVSMSVFADSILPNAQERLFRLGSSRLEVTVFTNILTLIIMTISTYFSGDLMGTINLAISDRRAALYMIIYISVAYVAISFHMHIVKRFGGVTAVLTATARKAMTIVISFIFFPKEFSPFYVYGTLLVLGGLLYSSLSKIKGNKTTSSVSTEGTAHCQSENDEIEFKSLTNEHTDTPLDGSWDAVEMGKDNVRNNKGKKG